MLMQVIKNAKQSFADVFQNKCSQMFHKFHKKTPMLESLLIKLQA